MKISYQRKIQFFWISFLTFSLSSFLALAGGPLIVTAAGAASVWDTSGSVSYHPESGSCGQYNNAEMLDRIEDNLETWTSLSFVDFDFQAVTGTLGDIDGSNYQNILVSVGDSNDSVSVNDGKNPIVFDDDGDIIVDVAGEINRFRVLGFANPAGFNADYSEIVDGQAVINCRCVAGNPNGACSSGGTTITFSDDEIDFTIIHEIGHFMNLDHTQVNDDLNDDDDSDDDDLPTMYPVSVSPALQKTQHRDDIVALARIYPSSTFLSSTCTLSGTVLDADGNPLRCADIQAITDDPADTVSFVSGALAEATDDNADGDTADSGECESGCGDFTLYLEAGQAYTIVVRSINSSFSGGSGISPCANDQLSTIVDETIGTVTAAQCTAGAALAFNSDIVTSSTGGVRVTTGSGSSGSSGCSLVSHASSFSLWPSAILLGFLVAFASWKKAHNHFL